MKKKYFYFVSVVLLLASCNNTGDRKISNRDVRVAIESVDTSRTNMMQEQPVPQKKVLNFDPIKGDTTTSDYQISYIIQDNDEVITSYPVTDGKGLDTVYYAGREVIVDINSTKYISLHKKIDRTFLTSYISGDEIHKYSIDYFNFEEIDDNERIIFTISLCIPDTDICYWFELYVSSNGDITISEIVWEEEN